jgi:hypothetical protein
MRAFSRLATIALLASHLAAASLPCPTAKSDEPVPEHGALASAPAHPCPGHADEEPEPAAWFDARCPCGCDTGVPPSGTSARTGPALLLAETAALCAPDRNERLAPPPQLARLALAPPDHVPLAIV